MSTLLREWLHSIGFDTKFDTLEKAFANGYHFGQVLHLLNLQPDFEHFRNSTKPVMIIENYERLQPTFMVLEVKINARIVKRLIAGDPHVAANLLNALRQNVQQKTKRPEPKNSNVSDGGELGFSRGFLQAQGYNSVKEAFYKGQARSFRETLDRALGSGQSDLVNKSLSRFWKHKEKVERDELNDATHQKEERLRQKSNNHFAILQKFRSNREAKRRLDAEKKAKHRAILDRKMQLDEWDAMATKELSYKDPSMEDFMAEAKEQISRFEEQVKVSESADNDASCNLATSRSELIQLAQEYESSLSQRRNKNQVQTTELVKEEEEHSSPQELLPDLTIENVEVLLESIQAMSAEETKICEQLRFSTREAELLNDNASKRNQYLLQQEQLEREVCIKRELLQWRQIKDDQKQKFNLLQLRRAEQQAQDRVFAQQRTQTVCKKLAWNIVKLMELKQKFKADIGHQTIPRRVKRDWSRLFIQDDSLLEITRPERLDLPREIKDALLETSADDYFYFKEDWATDFDVCAQSSRPIALWNGLIASEYHLRCEPSPDQRMGAQMKEFKLKIAVVGPPSAGCSSLSEKLRHDFGVEIIDLKNQIEDIKDQESTQLSQSVEATKRLQSLLERSSDNKDLLTGLVFDGYPAEESEAVSLEKHLSGLDLEAERRLLDGRSKLAPPPLHLLPDINRPLESSLDVVFLLSVSNENQLLERAMERLKSSEALQKGKNNKAKNSKKDFTQPGCMSEEALDDITKRVESGWCSFQEMASDLRSWFQRFDGLLVEIDASSTLEDTYASVRDQVAQICGAKEASSASKLTLQRSQEAFEEATKAQSAVESAAEAVACIARDLLILKRTEIAAMEDLGKTANDKSKKTVKSESLKLMLEQYNKGLKLLNEVESLAAICQESCNISEAANVEITSLLETGQIHSESLKTIEQNCKVVETQLNRCHEMSTKATEISQQATQLLSHAKDTVEQEDSTGLEAEKVLLSHQSNVSENTRINPSIEWRTPESLSSESITSLHQKWQTLEKDYFNSLKKVFALLREETVYFLDHFIHLKKEFLTVLEREDEKQRKTDEFVQSFNSIHPDIRKDAGVQGEWMLRCEELQEDLWKLCDEKSMGSEQQLVNLFNDGFKEEILDKIQSIHCDLIQVEINKLTALIDFSLQYAAQCYGHEEDMSLTIFSCGSLDLNSGEVPEALTALLSPKSGYKVPDWFIEASALSKETKQVLKLAFAYTELTKRDLEDPLETKSDAKAKKGGVKQSLESEDEVDRIKNEVKAFIGEAVNREVEITQHRFELIARHSMNALNELETFCECTRQACKSIHAEYHKQDCQSVAKLAAMLKGAVKDGSVFSFPVHRQRGMLRVVSDSEADTVNEENSIKRSTRNCLEADLLLLIKSFRRLYTDSYADVHEADKLCHECLMRPSELRKHLVASEDHNDVKEENCMAFVGFLNKQEGGYIDWRAMVCNMVVSWVATLRHSTVSDFSSAANVLQNCSYLNVEPNGMVTIEEWQEMDFWFKQDNTFDVCKVLWEIFYQDISLDDASKRKRVLDPRSALSSICLDTDGEIGVQKFRALHSLQLSSLEISESDIQDTYLPSLTKPDQREPQEQRHYSLAERLTLGPL